MNGDEARGYARGYVEAAKRFGYVDAAERLERAERIIRAALAELGAQGLVVDPHAFIRDEAEYQKGADVNTDDSYDDPRQGMPLKGEIARRAADARERAERGELKNENEHLLRMIAGERLRRAEEILRDFAAGNVTYFILDDNAWNRRCPLCHVETPDTEQRHLDSCPWRRAVEHVAHFKGAE